jgi:hypothetical protein
MFDWSCQTKAAKSNNLSDDDSSDDFSDDNADTQVEYDFPSFDAAIETALGKFNRKAFIKLNWSSPKDAYWSMNKLSCECLRDVYMLLSSSDFMSHDLNRPFDECDETNADEIKESVKNLEYYLVVRKWVHINTSTEFRCFVKNNKLVGKKAHITASQKFNNIFQIRPVRQCKGQNQLIKIKTDLYWFNGILFF